MLNWITNQLGNFTKWMGDMALHGVGNTIFTVGTVGEQLAILGIVVGIFLIRFRNTKVLRRSCMYYAVAILLELIGLCIIK